MSDHISLPATSACDRRVTVWFGSTPIARYRAGADQAAAYAAAMDRRFGSCRVTNEPAVDGDADLRQMPGARLWDETPALT